MNNVDQRAESGKSFYVYSGNAAAPTSLFGLQVALLHERSGSSIRSQRMKLILAWSRATSTTSFHLTARELYHTCVVVCCGIKKLSRMQPMFKEA